MEVTVPLVGLGVAAVAVVLGLSLTALPNPKVSLLGRRIATFVTLVSVAVVLLYVAVHHN
ncbi:MAG TPA: hypothetical protein VJ843_03530 [Candidatus Saccharimonadales bacterium]|nr:hypothetical protein [Candidatus Saccharimonadales bacterium]